MALGEDDEQGGGRARGERGEGLDRGEHGEEAAVADGAESIGDVVEMSSRDR